MAAARRPVRTGPPRGRRRINLALQGGGAHGAFTWGVLDRLLEEPDLEIVGVSGASAGAMNATVMAHGLAVGGHEGARAALAAFWDRLAVMARSSPLAFGPLERVTGRALGRLWLAGISQVASPYDLNPAGYNPLRVVLEDTIDFARLRRQAPVKLFVCATNARTGQLKVFGPEAISLDAVLASACLPQLFHAIEIDGEHYWDGGYIANPPVLPLVTGTDCGDTLIVQIDPIRIEALPTSARAIRERLQVLAFNAGFLREMHAIAALGRALDRGGQGALARLRRLAGRLGIGRRPVRLHLIEAEAALARLDATSKLAVGDAAFLAELFTLGRGQAEGFLARHKDAIGVRSSLDVAARFPGE
ncbi:patatin-like phospholipase family protein [Benzoatithermus flavus]|uniref:Patatin-like phospholipase family protein n=1 Tax=Benzoatithermus flavus TaxID=3108223 RepID=A0ABU8XXD6_9PROT